MAGEKVSVDEGQSIVFPFIIGISSGQLTQLVLIFLKCFVLILSSQICKTM